MKILTVVCIVLIALIAVSFAIYAKLTDNLIERQEIEITRLKNVNGALRKHVDTLSHRKFVKVENITINADPDNLPEYPSKKGF